MRRNIDHIEIKEPPIQELSKKRSCFKRTCFTGCGCIVIFILISLLLLKFIAGPRTKELKALPDNLPVSIPIYGEDDIAKISFISGKKKSLGIEIAAYVPKLILSPVILMLDNTIMPEKKIDENGIKTISRTASWSDFVRLMKEPISDQRDIVQIEWTFLTAEPNFISQYFATELKKYDYELIQSVNSEQVKQFSFASFEENIDGVVFIKDDPQDSGTDYVSLTAYIPAEN